MLKLKKNMFNFLRLIEKEKKMQFLFAVKYVQSFFRRLSLYVFIFLIDFKDGKILCFCQLWRLIFRCFFYGLVSVAL